MALGTPARSAVLLDPLAADRAGVAAVRRGPGGAAEVYLQLGPGESRVLRTFATDDAAGRAWPYTKPAGAPVPVAGPWAVEFVDGGPVLPAKFETPALVPARDASSPIIRDRGRSRLLGVDAREFGDDLGLARQESSGRF